MDKKLIALDFVEHDTAAALNLIMGLVQEGRVAGMVFAVQLKHHRPHHRMFGATGRLASNLSEGAGLASMLNCQIAHEALEQK
jgi:hypothetical protein